MVETRQASVSLPPEMIERLDVAARKQFTSRSGVVKQACAQWLEQQGTGVKAEEEPRLSRSGY